MKTLDAACRRILEAKYKLGLFDDLTNTRDLSRPGTRHLHPRAPRAAPPDCRRKLCAAEERDLLRDKARESFESRPSP